MLGVALTLKVASVDLAELANWLENVWNVKSKIRKANCDACRPIRWNGMGKEDCRGQTDRENCGRLFWLLSCGLTSSLSTSTSSSSSPSSLAAGAAAAALSSSAFVAPLEGHNLWFTCVNHFWSVATKCVCIWQAHIRPESKPELQTWTHFLHSLCFAV